MDKAHINFEIYKIVSDIRRIQSIGEFNSLENELNFILSEIQDDEFKVTIVGEFSSGKSTFLNALIGKDLLPHGTTETTATITRVHNVPKDDPKVGTIVVHFSDKKKESIVLNFDEGKEILLNYATTYSTQHKVVREIASVDIYTSFLDSSEKIVLIDTPGMNGVAEGHKQLTIDAINHSHASICLFHIRGLAETDVELINEVQKYQDSIFFVLNQIDCIHEDEGDTYEDRMQAFRQEISNVFYSGKIVPKHIFGVSALFALANKDKSIIRLFDKDTHDLTDQERTELWNLSHFAELEYDLFNYLRDNEKDKSFYSSIIERLFNILSAIRDSASMETKVRECSIEDIPERRELLRIKGEIAEKININQVRIENNLSALVDALQTEIRKLISQDCNDELRNLTNEVNVLNLDKLSDAVTKNVYADKLSNVWEKECSKLGNVVKERMQNIYEQVLSNMSKRLPMIQFGKNTRINIEVPKETGNDVIENLDFRLSSLRDERRQKYALLQSLNDGTSSEELRRDIKSIEEQLTQIRNDKQTQINNLGSRPSIQMKTRTKKEKKSAVSRFFGKIGNFFGGSYDSYKEIKEEYPDTTARDKYDRQKEELELEFKRKIEEKNANITTLNEMLSKALDNEDMRIVIQNKIDYLNRQIKEEEDAIEECKKIARTSLEKSYKNLLINYLNKNLNTHTGSMYSKLTSSCIEFTEFCEDVIKKEIIDLYKKKVLEYTQSIDHMISKINGRVDVRENALKVTMLKSDLRVIDECLNKLNNMRYGL